jgi:hypothetical protein
LFNTFILSIWFNFFIILLNLMEGIDTDIL